MPDAPAQLEQFLFRHVSDFFAQHGDASAIGPQQSYGEFEHGALARAGDSKHGFRFAVRQLKRNVLQHHFLIECDGNIVKLNRQA